MCYSTYMKAKSIVTERRLAFLHSWNVLSRLPWYYSLLDLLATSLVNSVSSISHPQRSLNTMVLGDLRIFSPTCSFLHMAHNCWNKFADTVTSRFIPPASTSFWALDPLAIYPLNISSWTSLRLNKELIISQTTPLCFSMCCRFQEKCPSQLLCLVNSYSFFKI